MATVMLRRTPYDFVDELPMVHRCCRSHQFPVRANLDGLDCAGAGDCCAGAAVLLRLANQADGRNRKSGRTMTEQAETVRRAFFGDGLFDWQIPVGADRGRSRDQFTFNTKRWWGTFPREDPPAVQGRRDDAEL